MTRYSIQPRDRIFVKGYGFLSSDNTIVFLKPDFNYCNSFSSSWVDKVTAGR